MKIFNRLGVMVAISWSLLAVGCVSNGAHLSSWHAFGKPEADRSMGRPSPMGPGSSSRQTVARVPSDVDTTPIDVGSPPITRTAGYTAIVEQANSSNAGQQTIQSVHSTGALRHAGSTQGAVGLTVLGPTDDLDSILRQHRGNVIIDFYADWCGPCRRLGAALHELERDAIANDARIVKVNIDKRPDLAQRFGVKGLPTIVLVQGGLESERHTGLVSAQFLQRWLVR